MGDKYILRINLQVINHLGMNLYSNASAVLSELIANAWDADAENVHIRITPEKNMIIIEDDGCGMNVDDVNDKFLLVGYQKREKYGDKTESLNRTVMGRKGIGKLSTFAIANTIRIFTKIKTEDTIGLELDVSAIKDAIQSDDAYYPKELPIKPENEIKTESGTRIELSNTKKRIYSVLPEQLRKRVARRFTLSSFNNNFFVKVNDVLVTIKDRDYLRKLEYVAVYDGQYNDQKLYSDTVKLDRRENTLHVDGVQYSISGWIGLVSATAELVNDNDNINHISILVRGKVAQEDILGSYKEDGLYTKYLIGEIEADFLDISDLEDIATTSRQVLIEDDPRFKELHEFIRQELKHISNKRVEYKAEQGLKQALAYPPLEKWYETLQGDNRKVAKKLFGKINQVMSDQDDRKILYKHAVFAFEKLAQRSLLSTLDALDINNLEAISEAFTRLDDIEASYYYDITRGRIEVINKLLKDVESNVLEKALQEHIGEHLWLIDPSWDRATENAELEKRVIETDAEKTGRIDIKYRKISGKHVIIELKRAERALKENDIVEQLEKYQSALEKETNTSEEIECIVIVGKELQEWKHSKGKKRSIAAMKAHNIRVILYHDLIRNAKIQYQEYLDAHRELEVLQEIEKM